MATEPTAHPPETLAQPPARETLAWSKWFRCESSFSLLLVPDAPGIYAVGEEVMAPGESPTAGGKRLLAVVQFAETGNLSRALSRLFTPASPLQERIAGGRCLLRYAVVADEVARQNACAALQDWLAASAESTPGPESQTWERNTKKKKADLDPPSLPAGF